MKGNSRMENAKDALKIFIRSLPVNCHFTITSFGSRFDNLWSDGTDTIPYNEQTMNEALATITDFSASYGGTQIVEPLAAA